jgi:chitinase
MITFLRSQWLCCLLCAGIILPFTSRADLWRTGYFVGYSDNSTMTPAEIDFSVVTHVVPFSIVPTTNASVDTTANSITPQASADLIDAAHAAGREALICVGGAGSTNFPADCNDANIGGFVNSIASIVSSRGY